MIIVTGGAGFIGSNLVLALNRRGCDNILVVDHLRDGTKFRNLLECDIRDYVDRHDFLERLLSGKTFGTVEAVFHQGACTDTTEIDGRYMMRNNYDYSKAVLRYCLPRGIPFLYASSAAVYGAGRTFREERACEAPLNVYGYSKFLFDQAVRRELPKAKGQIVGLRYFNVYGPREQHKARMASMVYHLNNQLLEDETLRLFEGSHGCADGEQRRDFVCVDDAVAVNLWFHEHPDRSGIFNVGAGTSRSFNEMARRIIEWHGRGTIEYVPFPDDLRDKYQSFTEADLEALRRAGYEGHFQTLEEGVPGYLNWLSRQRAV